eukprot:jgi/Mesen1/5207/ME000258S04307
MMDALEEGCADSGTSNLTFSTAVPPKYRLIATAPHLPLPPGSDPSQSSEVLSVLGGKASCRRKFVLHVQLLDDQVH